MTGRPRGRLPLTIAVTAILLPAAPASVRGEDAYESVIRPLLERYCHDCHGGEQPEAELSLTRFTDEAAVLADRPTWKRVWTVLHARENLPVLLGGGGNLGVTGGRHVPCEGRPLADLFLALLDRAGAPRKRVADSTGPLTSLEA